MEVRAETLTLEGQTNVSPVQRPPRTWAGHGTGSPCSTCGSPIGEQEIEYEVEAQPGSRPLHFHFNCYQDWMAHRGRMGT